ncbi:MAG TPA: 50S ribosomal protein L29 [Candidatus Dojkabacteria bacterium]|nr:50S ribosomal protein L29 [Candidatus Dojkabacteria bacterium]HRO64612.1 50S ribosomal protein L29 [Candidatus Dojkabacteria bacterium]HRP36444.1 50S ribosomal protein L29 [Candidatus Dojkabacteria bacterium]HRP51427.1 50S ribosomal protein L29 [Candidatus Dojkabacteria bacterium]
MNKSKLKTMELKELQTRHEKVSKELADLRYDVRIGQEKDYSQIIKKRKEVATINTLIKEIELGLHAPVKKVEAEKKETKKETKKESKKEAEVKKDKEEVKVKTTKKKADK